ncbi:hypothetical protein MKX01_019204 [Papaver californicum]|nr:hypothetical protein MKX01_019204 [Papaver californicum]
MHEATAYESWNFDFEVKASLIVMEACSKTALVWSDEPVCRKKKMHKRIMRLMWNNRLQVGNGCNSTWYAFSFHRYMFDGNQVTWIVYEDYQWEGGVQTRFLESLLLIYIENILLFCGEMGVGLLHSSFPLFTMQAKAWRRCS